MKIISFFLIYSLLFLSISSFAIENEEDIKVTKLIETDSSWEKTKIIYPNGDSKITALLVEMQPNCSNLSAFETAFASIQILKLISLAEKIYY